MTAPLTCSQRRDYRRAHGQTTPGTHAIMAVRAALASRARWIVRQPHEPIDGKPRPDARAARDARAALVSMHQNVRVVPGERLPGDTRRNPYAWNYSCANRKAGNRVKAQRKQMPEPKTQALPLTRRERAESKRQRKLDMRSQYLAARRAGLSCTAAREHAGTIAANRDCGVAP